FFPLDRLPEATTPATLRRIAEIFTKAEISPYW
ncbi:MAG: DNA mismatch repair protein MutT, partial [Mesorhizobium sp.]